MKKLLGITTAIIFLFIVFFGLNLSMKLHEEGNMAACPFMTGQSSMCQMSVGEHLSQWRQMFTATPQIFYQVLLPVIFFVGLSFLLSQFTLAPPNSLTLKFYKANHIESKLFNNLLLAFSGGILHPKVYA